MLLYSANHLTACTAPFGNDQSQRDWNTYIIVQYIYIYAYIIYVSMMYLYCNIYIHREERVWSRQCFCWLECAQCVYSWTRTLLGGLWNVHNFCDTCTNSVKRAQLLGNVHNISDTCTTSLTRAQTCTTSLKRAHIEYLKTLGGGGETRYTHIISYNIIYI